MLPTKLRFIWPSGFGGEEFLKSANQKQNFLWRPYLLMDRDEMSNLYRGPSIDASYSTADSIHSILVSDWFISKNLLHCSKLLKGR
jgi:hypothetical protein